MGHCVSYVTKCYVCNMKHETITYVPASQQGPHYTESGKRPIHSVMFQPVIVQLDSGYVGPAIWARDPEDPQMRFTFLSTGMVAINPAPVCWWHLPAAVPATEREWFDEVGPSRGYVMDTQTKPGQYRFMTNERRPQFGSWCETLDDAVTDAYNHWVAAGRP